MPTSRPIRSCLIVDDPFSRRTVFVAPGRAARPRAGPLDVCPFCAGHEHLTPRETLRSPADGTGPWLARIIPNRYPVVVEDGAGGGDAGRPAHGVHDVVIESPEHHVSVLDVEPAAWIASWRLVRDRLAALARRGDLAWGMVFKNSGPAAGASVDHVHSQLVALDFVPETIAGPALAAAGRDFPGLALEDARRRGRVVAEQEGLVAFVPRAPRQPFETWIVPEDRQRSFHEAGDATARVLAELARGMVARLARVVPGADYNWWLLQAPFAPADDGGTWRWRLEILPRVSPLAGFELATGCHICVETPRSAARLLRGGE